MYRTQREISGVTNVVRFGDGYIRFDWIVTDHE
jgi:hypothetical protein